MSTFVLVHGSWHGAWCWYKVIPRLEAAGHRVIAPDLPSLGRDKTPVTEIGPHTWADRICEILDAQAEPVVLVGHSRGGIVISQAGEARPHMVRALVYLAAFLLEDGQSIAGAVGLTPDSDLSSNFIMDDATGSSTVREEALRDLFYASCSEEDVMLARLSLQPEAMGPLATPIHTTPDNFGRIPRVYIECLRDNAVLPALQKQMYGPLPCERVMSIDTDHSPFFSAPEALTRHLIEVAGLYD
jgi:pimeloyl-ACP methyl ester carboxylesterase